MIPSAVEGVQIKIANQGLFQNGDGALPALMAAQRLRCPSAMAFRVAAPGARLLPGTAPVLRTTESFDGMVQLIPLR
jgi:hypothetical protein